MPWSSGPLLASCRSSLVFCSSGPLVKWSSGYDEPELQIGSYGYGLCVSCACFSLFSKSNEGACLRYGEPESPNDGGVFRVYDEPESPNERACLPPNDRAVYDI